LLASISTELGPIQFADKPNVPFKLLGFTDLSEDDFVYFKTAGGNWVAAAEDEAGRLFMIDEVGGGRRRASGKGVDELREEGVTQEQCERVRDVHG
jgi:hypothetical protein